MTNREDLPLTVGNLETILRALFVDVAEVRQGQIDLQAFFQRMRGELLVELHDLVQPGPKGDKGDKGDDGDQGERGLQGLKGDPGDVTTINQWPLGHPQNPT